MIITLAGSNDYLIETELNKIIEQFSSKNDDMAIEQIDGAETEIQSIIEAISGMSFLYPNRLIILRRGSANKQFIDSFEDLIKNIPQNNNLVIIEPNIDKRLSYFKTLKKITDFKMYENLDTHQLASWIQDTVKNNKGKISNSDARYLIELTGNNQLRISNELDKLLNFNQEITRENIDNLIDPIPQTTIFQLLDAAFNGNSKQLLKIYEEQKRQKVSPQQVIAMLTWQIHILAMIKASGKSSASEIASKTKVSPFVIGKSISIANKLTMRDIEDLTENLLELDIKLKNQSIDVDDALLQLLLTLGR